MKLKIRNQIKKIVLNWYRRSLPKKIKKIRTKEKIKVLFILNDVSKWKSELLYLAMLSHSRFEPIIRISLREGLPHHIQEASVTRLKTYLDNHNYQYKNYQDQLIYDADIVIYPEPYLRSVPKKDNILHRLNSIFININYCSHLSISPIDCFEALHFYAWIDCFENNIVSKEVNKYINDKNNRGMYMNATRNNIKVTGLPWADIYQYPPKMNPWKPQNLRKKRIIWAPHHSIGDSESTPFATFLDIANDMWIISQKYKDQVQWTFKPHPFLRAKLEKIWGKEKTNNYYSLWANSSNTQIEEGEYTDLFKCSDAMIHDSYSFISEYLYTKKPVMFIKKTDEMIYNTLNSFGKKALSLHSIGLNIEDIEKFIKSIIDDKDDEKYNEKCIFYENVLKPPYGKTASQNIIDAILASPLDCK